MGSSLKLKAIRTKDIVYISGNMTGRSYDNKTLNEYLFDEKPVKNTHKEGWYHLDSWPVTITKKVPGQRVNYRYELKAGFTETELTPKVLTDVDESISGLYDRKWDQLEDTTEEVEVEWDVVADIPNFVPCRPLPGTQNYVIHEITTEPVLLQEQPCFISGQEMYKIIRARVKRDIDGRYARVTSDYDFSFEVQKSIKYNTQVPYKVDIGTRRKPNMVTRYRTDKTVTVFKMGDSSKGYAPWPDKIEASSYKELEEKVNLYLDNLMKSINEPLVECPHCDGSGVVSITN